MVNFFIDRPIFASVVSIIITLAGAITLITLPIAEYPEIAPPSVTVTASYTGANARVVEESVAAPIEEQVNGAQDMLYMNSISSNDGRMSLTVTFELGRDLELATVDVQNRVRLAEPKLPAEVKQSGIDVKKRSPNMLMVINLTAPNGEYDQLFLNNYALINIKDSIARIPGVGECQLFGDSDYGMRVWLDPDALAKLGLTVTDVINAVREQNVQAPAGQIGQPPAPPGQEFQITVQVKGRLSEPEEFGNIILRANPDGSTVKIKDVGRVEMGAKTYNAFARLDGSECASLLIYQLPGANALEVAARVQSRMEELAAYFPTGIEYAIPYNTTLFVNESIKEVRVTLFQAMALVFLVVFIFLQNWRTTIIPTLAVPVSLIGTFTFFQILGFSINTLTLFGLVLAIGIVVDDAIVVVEAVQRLIDEEGMEPRAATKHAMKDLVGPVIATTLVLVAVFLPVAFMGGITGRLYQQFALTLAVSVVISSVNALTLSPAMCAILLRPQTNMRGPLGWFFGKFNAVFDKLTAGYSAVVNRTIRRFVLTLAVLLAVLVFTYGLFNMVPTGFVPSEDKGYMILNVQLPEGASLERTNEVMHRVEEYLGQAPGVAHTISLGGFNLFIGGYSSYTGTIFATLDHWNERQTPELSLDGILASTRKFLFSIQEAIVVAFGPPPIDGLGTTGGFQFELQDRSGGDVTELETVTRDFMAKANELPAVTNIFTPFSAQVPQLYMEIDREKVKKLGIPVSDVFTTLQTFLGGYYVNDFNKFGRTFRVMVQADTPYRGTIRDTNRFHVRSKDGLMIPLSTLSIPSDIKGPEYIRRYNLYRTIELSGATPPGYGSGQSIAEMEQLARTELPQGFGYEWTGIAYQEKLSGSQTVVIFVLALVMVFLVLAAQYESWSIPFAVLLAVPMGIFGAILGQYLRGLDNNVYAQIGLVMLIGLAAKNAILIVEFAMLKHEQGLSVADAAKEAAVLRFRPILMTAFSFILGVIPLVVASGAGQASRHALGTSVFSGMLVATILGVFMIPVLYVIIQTISDKMRGVKAPTGGSKEDKPKQE